MFFTIKLWNKSDSYLHFITEFFEVGFEFIQRVHGYSYIQESTVLNGDDSVACHEVHAFIFIHVTCIIGVNNLPVIYYATRL